MSVQPYTDHYEMSARRSPVYCLSWDERLAEFRERPRSSGNSVSKYLVEAVSHLVCDFSLPDVFGCFLAIDLGDLRSCHPTLFECGD